MIMQELRIFVFWVVTQRNFCLFGVCFSGFFLANGIGRETGKEV